MQRRQVNENGSVVSSVYFDKQVYDKLEQLCARLECSKSWLINKLLKEKIGIVDIESL